VNGVIVILENCIVQRCLDHGMHLITQPVHIPPFSNSAMKGNDTVPRYCCTTHHRTSPMFHCWNLAFQIVGFLGCSPNVNSSWCREQHEGWLIWHYHACDSSCLMSRFYGRVETPLFTPSVKWGMAVYLWVV
jgi:hypothetical protein